MVGCLPLTANFLHPPVGEKACFLHSELSFQDLDTVDSELTYPETGIVKKLTRNYILFRFVQSRKALCLILRCCPMEAQKGPECTGTDC